MPTEILVRDETVANFIISIVSDKGGSENTAFAYGTDLDQFCAGLPREVRVADRIDWQKIGRRHVDSFLAGLRSAGYADSTIARKLAAGKSFFAWLDTEDAIHTNPLKNMESPRAPKSLPTALTVDQVVSLMEQPRKTKGPVALRDTAMLELLYATGLRITELVGLNLGCIVVKGPNPCVVCPGVRKERTVPIHRQAVTALTTYLEVGRIILIRGRRESALFVNHRGGRMTRQGFWLIVKGYAAQAEIKVPVTPRTLRHSFATHMLRGGAPIRAVQKLLGHANISSTQVYTHIENDRARGDYEAAHPRAG